MMNHSEAMTGNHAAGALRLAVHVDFEAGEPERPLSPLHDQARLPRFLGDLRLRLEVIEAEGWAESRAVPAFPSPDRRVYGPDDNS